ncbi:MAG: PLP-dependent aminotransferase family protein [Acidobacteria bacterium]|nr:PLP-dependent aminotransferase family protein [Acidobacteriota bacterium]
MNFDACISLDPTDDAVPLYKQIYNSIRDAILDGALESGTRLPASRALAEQLGISRMTVVNAYDQLLGEGYLEGKHGSGTYVASHLPEEFLRVQVRKSSAVKTVSRSRRLAFSDYGKKLARYSERIAHHHSASIVVPFQHSLVAAEEFPFDLWAKINQKHLRFSSRRLGGYGDAAGFGPLRKAIAHHLRSSRGVRCEDEQVIVTAGTQQAVFLIANLLLARDDKVWLEDPCHLGTSDVMATVEAKVSHVPVDDEGFNIEKAKRDRRPARMVYVTPSRQFPLGMTMSLQRRLSLLEWANDNEAWVIEDDYDSEFRYSGRPLPALQGLDRADRVLYVGTFSKTVFPGLRIGCLVVPPDLIDVFIAARALNDLHAPITDQMVLADFIVEGHFEHHVRRMRTLYRGRQAVLVDQAAKHLGGFLDVGPSDAGMHLTGWLPKGVDDREVSTRVAEHGLRAAPVSRYTNRKLERGGLLLGYTAFNEKQINAAVRKLAKIAEVEFNF